MVRKGGTGDDQFIPIRRKWHDRYMDGQNVTEKVDTESNMQEKPLVLILCTGNSCRSHLAEGILRQKAGDLIRVESAGSKPTGFVHPLAIRAMEEIGIDISGHRSKHTSSNSSIRKYTQ